MGIVIVSFHSNSLQCLLAESCKNSKYYPDYDFQQMPQIFLGHLESILFLIRMIGEISGLLLMFFFPQICLSERKKIYFREQMIINKTNYWHDTL